MPKSLKEAAEYSRRWLEIIQKEEVTEAEGKQIIEESKYNFAEHFNKNWLEYRKSVTEDGEVPAPYSGMCLDVNTWIAWGDMA
jgi:putrescine aminotransferase